MRIKKKVNAVEIWNVFYFAFALQDLQRYKEKLVLHDA